MPSRDEFQRLADTLKAAGRLDEAIDALRSGVAAAPGNAIAMHNLAAALGDAGRGAEAAEWARRALAAGLDAPETWLVLARALTAEGRAEEAEQAFAEALRRRPVDPTIHRDAAQLVWMRSGDRALALRRLDDAIARHPTLVELRVVRARALGQMGDAAGEHAEALNALRLGGSHPVLLTAAANAALGVGDAAAAVGHARAAAAAAPGDGPIGELLCRTLLAIGDVQDAAAVATRLRASFPLDQHCIALEATAWRLLGDPRYHELYDYENLVRGFPLGCPPGWASAERYVDDLVEALDRQHRFKTHPFGQSVRHGSQLPSIDRIDEPALQAVAAAIDAPVRTYLDHLGQGPDPLRARNGHGHRLHSVWSVRLAASGHHVSHVHPQGWLSSAGHLRFPAPADTHDLAGCLTFGAPGVPTMPPLAAEHVVRPQRGVLVMFPSYMWHATMPFDGAGTRLSIAADLVPGPAR